MRPAITYPLPSLFPTRQALQHFAESVEVHASGCLYILIPQNARISSTHRYGTRGTYPQLHFSRFRLQELNLDVVTQSNAFTGAPPYYKHA